MRAQDLGAFGNATTYLRNNAVATSTLNLLPTTYNQSLSGFIGGLTFGANYKFAHSFVAGLEGDLDGTAGNTSTVWDLASSSGGGSAFTTYGQHTATLNYLGTARGRLGYLATPELLLFGTAGLAYGGVTAANSYVSVNNASGLAPTVYGPQYTGTLTGWTAGGGVEWAISPEWTLKADYLHYNLGTVSATNVASSNIWSPYVANPGYSATGWGSFAAANASFSGNLIRGGVNRHFNLLSGDAKDAAKPVLAAAIAEKPVAPAKPVNWGGGYAGVNLGGIWANQNSINNITAWPYAGAPQYMSSASWLSGAAPASGTAALLGGGQIGYNVELNKLWKFKFVAGVEADIQGVAPGGTKGGNSFVTTLNAISLANQAIVSQSATNSLAYLGTARGRFGFALIPSILLYGTGGLAYGNTNTSLQAFSGLGSLGGWQGGSTSVSSTQLGWTAGGGTEWAFRDHWSVKGEYLYYDLGKASGSVTNYAFPSGSTPTIGSQSQFTQRFSGNILRAGLNYHFNDVSNAPVVAGY